MFNYEDCAALVAATVDVEAAIGGMTAAELAAALEHTDRLRTVRSQGFNRYVTELSVALLREKARRDLAKAREAATFDIITAESQRRDS